MQKKARKKLALRKQTLRGLSEKDLGTAQGGTFTTIGTIGTINKSLLCPSRVVCPSFIDACPSALICGGGNGPQGPQY